MKTRYAVTLAMLPGVAFGAVVVNGLKAQGEPPTYVIVDISDVTDPDGFKTVLVNAPALINSHGGRFIICTDKITGIDGTPPKRFVVIAFDSMQKAQAWSNSPEVKNNEATRVRTTKSRSFMVDGM